MFFLNRYDAAMKLAPLLEKYKNEEGVILAVPRGGVLIGCYLAKHLDFPLDLLMTKKIGHPAADPKTNYHQISISDNGIGFEQEYAEKVFQIFQRLHGKTEYPGSGIGLSICKKIVDKHNGIVYAESKLGHGTTFFIILPEKQ